MKNFIGLGGVTNFDALSKTVRKICNAQPFGIAWEMRNTPWTRGQAALNAVLEWETFDDATKEQIEAFELKMRQAAARRWKKDNAK